MTASLNETFRITTVVPKQRIIFWKMLYGFHKPSSAKRIIGLSRTSSMKCYTTAVSNKKVFPVDEKRSILTVSDSPGYLSDQLL